MTLEGIILGLLSLAALLSMLPRHRFAGLTFIIAATTLGLVLLYYVLGLARLLMMPAVILAVLILAFSGVRRGEPKKKSWIRDIGLAGYAVFMMTGLGVSLLLPLGLPAFTAPAPDGPYAIGLARAHLVDADRAETATPDNPDDRRELVVQAWYPASLSPSMVRAPLFPDPRQPQRLLAGSFGLPAAAFSYVSGIAGHGVIDAPVETGGPDNGRYPVLVFSHGFGSFSSQNSLLMEHLASHGYIVFSIDHPYQATWVELSEGREVAFLQTAFDSAQPSEEEIADMIAALKGISKARSYDDYYQRVSDFMMGSPDFNDGLDIWIEDTSFFWDELMGGRVDAFGFLDGHMDLDRLGVFGMSYGGATAGMVCANDSRCKAGLNMDGLQYGNHDMRLEIDKPFMIMNADRRLEFGEGEDSPPLPFEMNDFVYAQATGPAYSLTISGAKHINFGDLAYLAPLATLLGVTGSIDASRMNAIMNAYVTAFFDQHLRESNSLIELQARDEFPEVLAFVSKPEAGRQEN